MNDHQEIIDQTPSQGALAATTSRMPAAGVNHASVMIESERAIAEARGQMQLAKMFPRSMAQAMADLMEACKSPEFAKAAFYSVPNRGSGPSIRFAEEVARVYGNFQYGHRELSRGTDRTLVEVFAWDVQNNNRSARQVTVLHIRDTQNGPKKLTDQADIDGRIANVASKQMRGRILALVPKSLVAAGVEACKLTIAGGNDQPISARVKKMTEGFAKFGVTARHLAAYIGHTLDDITVDELADLIGVFNAIKEGAKPSEYFDTAATPEAQAAQAGIAEAVKKLPAADPQQGAAPAPATTTTRRTVTRTAATKAAEAPAPSPAPEPAPAPDPAPAPAQAATQGGNQQPPDMDDAPPLDEFDGKMF